MIESEGDKEDAEVENDSVLEHIQTEEGAALINDPKKMAEPARRKGPRPCDI